MAPAGYPEFGDRRIDAAATEAREAVLDGLRRLADEREEDTADGVDEFSDDEYAEIARFALRAADAVDPVRLQMDSLAAQFSEVNNECDSLHDEVAGLRVVIEQLAETAWPILEADVADLTDLFALNQAVAAARRLLAAHPQDDASGLTSCP